MNFNFIKPGLLKAAELLRERAEQIEQHPFKKASDHKSVADIIKALAASLEGEGHSSYALGWREESADCKFELGQRVTKSKGSQWTGRIVGFYSTDLTPIGYAVESETEKGSVQIYPEVALMDATHGSEVK